MENSILKVKNLNLSFNKLEVIKDLSLDIGKGEFVTILGPSGVGKTVLLKLLTKILLPNSGEITFTPQEKNNLNVSMAFQKSNLFNWLSVYENLKISMSHSNMNEIEKRKKIESFLEFSRMINFSNSFPSELSGGMAQKINLIRAFLQESETVLMDEPLSSIDTIQKMELQDFILKLWEKQKKTIIYVTHDIEEAIYMSDRILLLPFVKQQKQRIKEIVIPFNRPRKRIKMLTESKYVESYKFILDFLKSELEVEFQ
ncbi:MAG: ABC transporter ATP-binding protein [Bdellovibrionales bacterium]|nr:ABC transporter ATP-binding protein [Bdellovibrionales bacterium]